MDLAAARVGSSAIPILVGFLILIAFTLVCLKHPLKGWIPYLNLVLVFGLIFVMLSAYKHDPEYYLDRQDLFAAQEQIRIQPETNDLVLIKSYNTPVWYYWMNWADPELDWISLPFYFPKPAQVEEYQLTDNPELVLDEATLKLLRDLLLDSQRVWLVLPSDTPGAALEIEADWLRENSTISVSWSFEGDGTETDLYLFELGGN
jgi:hypothetical protein